MSHRSPTRIRWSPHPPAHSAHLMRHRIGAGLIALAMAVLPLLTGCGGASPGPDAGATTTATAHASATPPVSRSVAVPGPHLAWQAATYPAGIDPTRETLALRVAPGDGDIAYLCVAPSTPNDTMAHIYITRDGARTWTHGAAIVVGAQPPATNHYFFLTCDIAIDANNPAAALIMEAWVQVASDATIGLTNYATFDFAAHWQRLAPSQPQRFIADGNQMASWQGSIYAYGASRIPFGSDQGIWVSADQMRTWRRLTPPAGLIASAFWVDPASGALLMLAGSDFSSPPALYASGDHGATWTAIAPQAPSGQGDWIVAAPQAGQPWHLCRETIRAGGQQRAIACSEDGGQTWSSPQPGFVYQVAFNPKGNGFWVISEASDFAVASDGAVLAAGDGVYRLPAGGSAWQDLGPMPGSTSFSPPHYYPTLSGGVLWLSVGSGWEVASYPAT